MRTPARGDIIWLQFNPQLGREQAGRRPALVLSPASYNERTGLCLVCPVTSRVKGYPFEEIIPAGLPVTGAVLCDQIKSLAWAERKAEFAGTVPPRLIAAVRAKLRALLEQD